jgi:hypothetical protein
VQNRVKALLGEVGVQMREDLRKQFSSADDSNPLATFQRMAIGAMRDNAQAQSQQLKAMDEKLATLREDVLRLQAEKDKLEVVAAEAQRGTAKGPQLRGGGGRRRRCARPARSATSATPSAT